MSEEELARSLGGVFSEAPSSGPPSGLAARTTADSLLPADPKKAIWQLAVHSAREDQQLSARIASLAIRASIQGAKINRLRIRLAKLEEDREPGLSVEQIRARWGETNAKFFAIIQADHIRPRSSPDKFSVEQIRPLIKDLADYEGDGLQLGIDPAIIYSKLAECYAVLSRRAPQELPSDSDIGGVSLSKLANYYQQKAEQHSKKG